MEDLNLKSFNDVRNIYNVIGNLCKDTTLLMDSNVELKTDDFMQRLHKIIFSAINNITYNKSGDKVTSLDAKDIDNYLSVYPTQYKIWNEQKGFEYVAECIEHSNKETFWQSYQRVKKMSVLRAYQLHGFDVKELFDWETDDMLAREKSLVELDNMKLEDIFQYFTLKNLKIKDDYNIETVGKQFKAGEDIEELLHRMEQGVEYGAPYISGFDNYLIRGQRKGKFVIRSGNTGSGKTILSMATMINNAVNKVYRDGKWVYNGVSLPSLFISTELEKDELDVIALAFITGIPRNVIQDGKFTEKQRKLLIEAGKVVSNSPLHLYHIPDFSVADINDIIERNILDNDVGYISFDYMQTTPKLVRTTNEIFQQNQREDQILLFLSTSLKALAEKYNVYIESATQLNRNAKEEGNRDATSLAGGSSMANKTDNAMLLFRAKDEDREKVAHIIEENGFGKEPNYMKYLYKSRSSRADLIMWSYMDTSIIREEPLFVTDLDYNIIEEVKNLHYEFQDGKTEQDIKDEKKYAGDEDAKVFGTVTNKVENMDF